MGTYSVIAQDGQLYGPVNESGIIDWIKQGRVARETLLHCHETNARSAAWTVPALQEPLGLSPVEVQQLLHPTNPPPQPLGYAGPPVPAHYGQPRWYGGPARPQVSEFPVVGAVLLSLFVPIFAAIYYGIVHGDLPKRRPDDPSAAKAIGFMFIPFFNLYWMCFFWIRLCTRLNDERALVALPPTAPRGLVIAICWCYIGLFIPLVNLLAIIAVGVMSIVAVAQIHTCINQLSQRTTA
jgi:hypothetical protein